MRAASSLLVVECLLYGTGQIIIISKLASTTDDGIPMRFFVMCVHMEVLICAEEENIFFDKTRSVASLRSH